MQANNRLYHVIVINEKTGSKTYMTAYPTTHEKAMINISKLTQYKWRRIQVEEV